ncbi:MAG: GFA family protein [Candidatus Andeanibacterium colombiense]|uniref:GFA family protein n=1 Tax=Candidatus Andeanibacterium colombiense TaxID=3121345 RepID=A0AAJ5X7I7_9SPHN|nr:MAG: GFA family protein [Sphingomonadaceae bacterium]
MSDTSITGSCHCGAVQYEIEGDLPPAYCCHCGECKKQSASAFSMSIGIAFSRLAVKGEPGMFETVGYSGAVKRCYFCKACGTRLWHRSGRNPEFATLKVGTLDNGRGIAPSFHLWVSQKQAGIELDPAVPAYQTQPDNLIELRERMAGTV